MNQSFYTGITGLSSSQFAIDVVSDNLSNLNTVGFKSSEAEFASIYNSSLDRASSSNLSALTGAGTKIQATSVNLSQGEIISGDRNTELAIDGDGWFGVKGNGETEYTRNGNFTFDASRDLVTQERQHVLGTLGGNIQDGVLTETLSSVALGDVNAQKPLNLPESLHYPVEATKNASFSGNLGIEEILVKASSTVISSSSDLNALNLAFTQSDPQPDIGSSWDIVATVTNADGTTTYDTQNGVVTFGANGGLENFTLAALDNDGTAVNVDFGEGSSGLIAIDNQLVSISSSADGFEAGELVGYTINEDANIIAGFSNGRSSSIGKVALYHFQNDQGLDKLSGSRFTESSNSGKPIFFTDANGKNINGSTILNYHLENSNVRVEVGLTDLIIMQRAYDANSKTISTSDQMLQKALQMDA